VEYVVSDERKADQKRVDEQVLAVITKHSEKKYLTGYLASRFCLNKGDLPHKMVF